MSVLGAKPTSHRHVAVVLFWLADVGCQARCAKVSLKALGTIRRKGVSIQKLIYRCKRHPSGNESRHGGNITKLSPLFHRGGDNLLFDCKRCGAVELKLLSPHAMKTALNDLVPAFEQASGHRVTIFYAPASKLLREIQEGKVADVAILSPEEIEQLEEDDKVVEDSLAPVAKVEIGLIIQRGTTKPDLSRFID